MKIKYMLLFAYFNCYTMEEKNNNSECALAENKRKNSIEEILGKNILKPAYEYMSNFFLYINDINNKGIELNLLIEKRNIEFLYSFMKPDNFFYNIHETDKLTLIKNENNKYKMTTNENKQLISLPVDIDYLKQFENAKKYKNNAYQYFLKCFEEINSIWNIAGCPNNIKAILYCLYQETKKDLIEKDYPDDKFSSEEFITFKCPIVLEAYLKHKSYISKIYKNIVLEENWLNKMFNLVFSNNEIEIGLSEENIKKLINHKENFDDLRRDKYTLNELFIEEETLENQIKDETDFTKLIKYKENLTELIKHKQDIIELHKYDIASGEMADSVENFFNLINRLYKKYIDMLITHVIYTNYYNYTLNLILCAKSENKSSYFKDHYKSILLLIHIEKTIQKIYTIWSSLDKEKIEFKNNSLLNSINENFWNNYIEKMESDHEKRNIFLQKYDISDYDIEKIINNMPNEYDELSSRDTSFYSRLSEEE